MTTYIRPESVTQPRATPVAERGTRLDASRTASADSPAKVELAKLERAAKDFEAVFLRQMLVALEKTTKVGDKGPNVAGQQTYGSMIVEAVADAVASAGGLGLTQMLTRTLGAKLPEAPRSTGILPELSRLPTSADSLNGRASFATSQDRSSQEEISPQGFSSHAVPRTEIRATASQRMEPQADRRIR